MWKSLATETLEETGGGGGGGGGGLVSRLEGRTVVERRVYPSVQAWPHHTGVYARCSCSSLILLYTHINSVHNTLQFS